MLRNTVLRISLISAGIFALLCANAQPRKLSLDEVISLSVQSKKYKILQSDSLIHCYNNKLFNIAILPQISLTGTLPNLSKSINNITQNDGSERFRERYYSNTSVGINISQLVPFSGGTLSVSSNLNRIDNFAPYRNRAYNTSLIDVSYTQKLFGYNAYKWEKKLNTIKNSLFETEYLQRIESIKEEAVKLFFDLYVEQQNHRLILKQHELSTRIYEKSKKLYAENKIMRQDMLEAEIDFHKSKNNCNDFVLRRLKLQLLSFLELPADLDVVIELNPDKLLGGSFNFDAEKIAESIIQLNDERQLELELVQHEQKLREVNSAYGPEVKLSAGTGLNSGADRFQHLTNDYTHKFNTVLSVSLPIFDGGKSRTHKRIIKEKINNTNLNYSILKEDHKYIYEEELNYFFILCEEMRQNHRLIELMKERIDLLLINLDYGKVDMEKLIDSKAQLIRNETIFYQQIRDAYLIIHKYRRLALLDIRYIQ